MRHGDWAWLGLAAGVLTYEAGAALHPEAELLSEAVDRYRRQHPIVTLAVIGYVAAHLARLIPARWDPLHRMAEAIR